MTIAIHACTQFPPLVATPLIGEKGNYNAKKYS